ncbi:MAG: ribosome maturation factor RimM [Bacillota bacterium]
MNVDSNRQHVVIGKILAPHGNTGLLKVFPYSDFPERCSLLTAVMIELNGERRPKTVERASVHGRFWLFKFDGIDSREQAALISGGTVLIPAEERLPLPRGSYYFNQIVGLQVFTAAGELLGRISRIIPGGGHDLYVVARAPGDGAAGAEILVPAVRQFVKQIDLDTGKMVVDLPEGLVDL